MSKILVLATSRKSHGGISSVVMAHERGAQWKDMDCHWVVTHKSGSAVVKMWYLMRGMVSFLVRVPFCKLVHIHTSEPPSAKRKRMFMRIAKALGKKVIVHFHAFDTASTIKSSSQEVYRYLFSNADVVLALSPTWKRAINEVFDLGEKVQVLYNPCPTIAPWALDKKAFGEKAVLTKTEKTAEGLESACAPENSSDGSLRLCSGQAVSSPQRLGSSVTQSSSESLSALSDNPSAKNKKNNSVVGKKKQILSAGVVNARKGYKDLIKGFKIALERLNSLNCSSGSIGTEWKLVFAGSGEIEEGKALAKELGIESQVEFLGWVAGEAKDRVFRETSIFCLPSYAEGFPMAVLDAWAYGLPVVATPVGGLPDIVKDGEDCLLFNPGDCDQLAVQLERMITDEELREKIEAASRNFAEKVFNEDVINGQLAEIYKGLMG